MNASLFELPASNRNSIQIDPVLKPYAPRIPEIATIESLTKPIETSKRIFTFPSKKWIQFSCCIIPWVLFIIFLTAYIIQVSHSYDQRYNATDIEQIVNRTLSIQLEMKQIAESQAETVAQTVEIKKTFLDIAANLTSVEETLSDLIIEVKQTKLITIERLNAVTAICNAISKKLTYFKTLIQKLQGR